MQTCPPKQQIMHIYMNVGWRQSVLDCILKKKEFWSIFWQPMGELGCLFGLVACPSLTRSLAPASDSRMPIIWYATVPDDACYMSALNTQLTPMIVSPMSSFDMQLHSGGNQLHIHPHHAISLVLASCMSTLDMQLPQCVFSRVCARVRECVCACVCH